METMSPAARFLHLILSSALDSGTCLSPEGLQSLLSHCASTENEEFAGTGTQPRLVSIWATFSLGHSAAGTWGTPRTALWGHIAPALAACLRFHKLSMS